MRYLRTHTHVHVYIYIYIIYIHTYIRTYTHIHTYIHTYIHIYIHTTYTYTYNIYTSIYISIRPGGGSVLLDPSRRAHSPCAIHGAPGSPLPPSASRSLSSVAPPGTAHRGRRSAPYPHRSGPVRSTWTPTYVELARVPPWTRRFARFARHTTGYVSHLHRDPR